MAPAFWHVFVKQKSEQKGSKKVSTISTTLRVVSMTAGAPNAHN